MSASSTRVATPATAAPATGDATIAARDASTPAATPPSNVAALAVVATARLRVE
jgi:hypothetical protein